MNNEWHVDHSALLCGYFDGLSFLFLAFLSPSIDILPAVVKISNSPLRRSIVDSTLRIITTSITSENTSRIDDHFANAG